MKTKMSALFVMLELIQMKEIKNVQVVQMEPFLQMIEQDVIYANLEHIQTKELQNVFLALMGLMLIVMVHLHV